MGTLEMEEFPICMLCGVSGKQIYRRLEDRLFGVPGRFSLSQCPSCGLLWLNPRPILESILKCYDNYYTHDDKIIEPINSNYRRPLASLRDAIRKSILCGYYGYQHLHTKHLWCHFGSLLAKIPFLRDRASYDMRELFPHFRKGLIIDIGCGKGAYLKMMRALGWEVLGIEPDPKAVHIAQGVYEVPVFKGTLENAGLSEKISYQITMNHVIEHLPNPVSTIKECHKILIPGGRLVIYTPNAESLGHKVFKEKCFHLDPPRHLFVFSPRSIYLLFLESGFKKVYIKTISRSAGNIYDSSILISKKGTINLNDILPQKGRNKFICKEVIGCFLCKKWGEEIEVIGVKPEAEK